MFRENLCIHCDRCLAACGVGAISRNGGKMSIDRGKCTLCGDCVEFCYAEALEIVGRQMTVAQVMEEIERDVAFYDESGGGVTFSGGEPLSQPDFLFALLRACAVKGIHTVLDTCGFALWETLDGVRECVDLFLYDLKLMDAVRHREFTGVSNELILDNLRALSQQGHDIILRLPIIPGINDDDENIRQTGAFAAALPHLERVDILPYHRIGLEKYHRLGKTSVMPETQPPSQQRIAEMVDVLMGFGLRVKS